MHGIYILAENAAGLVLVDMHAAHERIVYERLKAQMDAAAATGGTAALASQPLLIPATLAATAEEIATAEAHADTLQLLGLEITPLSAGTLAVRAVPATLAWSKLTAVQFAVMWQSSQVLLVGGWVCGCGTGRSSSAPCLASWGRMPWRCRSITS